MAKISWNIDGRRSSKPNFLIIGAARSGTTSLYHYLRSHPQVYFGAKEPKFFSSQNLKFPLNGPGDQKAVNSTYITDFENYKKLFLDVKSEKAIGEASADNLYYHDKTIPLIKKYLGNPKIIIMLRNPIERAFSSYTTLKLDNREKEPTFKKALRNEEDRIKNNWEFIWHYKKASLYSKAVKNYLENFPNVKVVLFDDFKRDTERIVGEIYEFLGVNKNHKFDFKAKYASSGKIKNKSINRLILSLGPVEKKIIKPVSSSLGIKNKLAAIKARVMSKNIKKERISEVDKLHLMNYFKKDIMELENLLKKDLSNWKK